MPTKAPKLVPRAFTDAMGKKLRNMSIYSGGHNSYNSKQACIMEAISVITDQPFTDDPVCVSDEITSAMIYLNDHVCKTNKDRNKLKKAVPQLIGTAPVITIDSEHYDSATNKYVPTKQLVTHYEHKGYRKAEQERGALIIESGITEGDLNLKESLKVIEQACKIQWRGRRG